MQLGWRPSLYHSVPIPFAYYPNLDLRTHCSWGSTRACPFGHFVGYCWSDTMAFFCVFFKATTRLEAIEVGGRALHKNAPFVAMPCVPSSVLLLLVRPGAPNSVLASENRRVSSFDNGPWLSSGSPSLDLFAPFSRFAPPWLWPSGP